MINRGPIQRVSSSLSGLGPVKLLLLVGGVLLVAVVAGFFLLSGDGGAAGASDSDLVINFDDPLEEPLEGDAAPGLSGAGPSEDDIATRIAEAVEATAAATEPTPTPAVTPDLPATIRAQVFNTSPQTNPVISANPLDSGGIRNPFLSQADHAYLASLGEDLWVATQLYLRMRELSSTPLSSLSFDLVDERLRFVDGLLDSLDQVGTFRAPSGEVSEVVLSYGGFVESGISSVQQSVREFRGIRDIFEEKGQTIYVELDSVSKDDVSEHYRVASDQLVEFSTVMSAYGCSVCGELFRGSFRLE